MVKYCKQNNCSYPVFGGGYCLKHQSMRHGGRWNYILKAKEFKKSNALCKANLEGCTKKTQDVHHKKGRSGSLLMDENYWLPVCRNCHRIIEQNPKMAKELGLSESRLN